MAKQITKAERDAALKVIRAYALQEGRTAAKKGKVLAKAGGKKAGAAAKSAGKGFWKWQHT